MTAKLLDGNAVAEQIRAETAAAVDRWHRVECQRPPSLVVVLCSDDPASEIYVQRKRLACSEVGITDDIVRPFDGRKPTMDRLLGVLDELNDDPAVDGVLVQLPLPEPLDRYAVFDRLDPLKDVDVFSPANVGLLLQGRPRYVPCTPAGVQQLLVRSGVEIEGKRVVVVNRSDVVGKPLHALLVQDRRGANATVTVCHDHTPPPLLKEACLAADIVVVAVGKPGFLTADMVSPGAAVVDVGINRTGQRRVVGDVDFAAVAEKAAWISPVPGGVGPCTVAMLLHNVVQAYEAQRKGWRR